VPHSSYSRLIHSLDGPARFAAPAYHSLCNIFFMHSANLSLSCLINVIGVLRCINMGLYCKIKQIGSSVGWWIMHRVDMYALHVRMSLFLIVVSADRSLHAYKFNARSWPFSVFCCVFFLKTLSA
jgi:hypothetical protein